MTQVIGYATKSASSSLKPLTIERRDLASNDIDIEILYCGICHSDVHQARNEWKNTVYPCMPGHEIVGRVKKIGSAVTKFKVGDIVGVGCMVDSCHHCKSCNEGLQQYCDEGFLATYNGNMRKPAQENLTFGGYSSAIVVREDFVLKIPSNLDRAAACPLMCAGITCYSPLRYWQVGPGTRVGVVGLGGLGHIAIKLAVAMGAEVTLITRSPEKEGKAKKLGVKNIIISTDKESMEKGAKTLDFILNTVPQPHDANPYITLLDRDGVLTIVGCVAPLTKGLDLSKMIPDRKSMGTSLIGGIAETQEVLDFCSKHNIVTDIEIIPIDEVNEAYDRINKGGVDFRYVIDMATLKGKEEEKGLLEKMGL